MPLVLLPASHDLEADSRVLRDEGWPPQARPLNSELGWRALGLELRHLAGLVVLVARGEDHAVLHWAALAHHSCPMPPALASPPVVLAECLPLDVVDLAAEEELHVLLGRPLVVVPEAERADWCELASSEGCHHLVGVEAEGPALVAEVED